METNRNEIKTVSMAVLAILLMEILAFFVISKSLISPLVILGITRSVEIILLILIVWFNSKGLADIGLDRSGLLSGFRNGLIWSIGFGVVVTIGFTILYIFDINPFQLIRTRIPAYRHEIFLFMLIGGLVSPVAEEIFFRGILYGFFRRWGIALAVVLSTTIFVLVHPARPTIPIPQIVGGIVFAVAYEVEGSLIAPIVIHILGNIAIYTLSLTVS